MNNNYIKVIRNHSGIRNARVETVNADGSYSVRIKGRSEVIDDLPPMALQKFSEGDNIIVGAVEGDSQKLSILGYGGFYASMENVTEISI